MKRDHPPCNTCPKHECRTCAWTSPLDAAYRVALQSNPIYSKFAPDVCPQTADESWLEFAAKRVVRFFSDSSPRAR